MQLNRRHLAGREGHLPKQGVKGLGTNSPQSLLVLEEEQELSVGRACGPPVSQSVLERIYTGLGCVGGCRGVPLVPVSIESELFRYIVCVWIYRVCMVAGRAIGIAVSAAVTESIHIHSVVLLVLLLYLLLFIFLFVLLFIYISNNFTNNCIFGLVSILLFLVPDCWLSIWNKK